MSESLCAPIRTAIFVPGDRPDRFGRATASGADLVILDLEDAVSASNKARARETVFHSLSTEAEAAVRINILDTDGEADLDMLAQLRLRGSASLRAVLVPKTESVDDISNIARILPGLPIIPLIETAAGLAACEAIARSPQVERLAFGALDFGADVGATNMTMLDFARCQIVVNSRIARLALPLDSPNTEFRNSELVRAGAKAARSLGFGGQLCIHPLQVAVVAEAFRPTSDEIAWAQRVTSVEGSDGVIQIDGAMVDRPVLLRANAILQQLNN